MLGQTLLASGAWGRGLTPRLGARLGAKHKFKKIKKWSDPAEAGATEADPVAARFRQFSPRIAPSLSSSWLCLRRSALGPPSPREVPGEGQDCHFL